MKRALLTPAQLVLLLVVVVVLVFGVTYACTNIGRPSRPQQPAQVAAIPAQLDFAETTFPEATLPGGPDPRANSFECEWHTFAHHDYWFHNTSGNPVEVWSNVKSCKCTKVELTVLPDDWQGLSKTELEARAQDSSLTWQELNNDKPPVTVSPHAAGTVRLTWKGQLPGPETLSAQIETRSKGVTGQVVSLEAKVFLVPALRLTPAEEKLTPAAQQTLEVSAGEFRAGDVRTVELLCWSSTRKEFSLKPGPSDNPCIVCDAPQRLRAAECDNLTQRDGQRVLCAYRVPVTVREQTPDGKHELDLGPIRTVLQLTSDPDLDPLDVTVTGTVRGELTVGSAEDRDRVSLGSFDWSEGKTREITLTSDQGDLTLEKAEKPDFLEVDLREEKAPGLLGQTWTLTVKVPPKALDGVIPQHTAVVLQTKGAKSRRIRIPVTGNAYVR